MSSHWGSFADKISAVAAAADDKERRQVLLAFMSASLCAPQRSEMPEMSNTQVLDMVTASVDTMLDSLGAEARTTVISLAVWACMKIDGKPTTSDVNHFEQIGAALRNHN